MKLFNFHYQYQYSTKEVYTSKKERRGSAASTSGSVLAEAAAGEVDHELKTRNPSVDSVDVYEATVDGKKANIVVSQDSMAIYTKEDLKARKTTDNNARDTAIQNAINNTFLEKVQKFSWNWSKWNKFLGDKLL